MMQRFKDLLLLLQKDRKAQAIAVCIALAFLFILLKDDKPRMQPRQRNDQAKTGTGATASSEAYKDIVHSLGSQVEDLRRGNQEIATNLEKTQQNMQEYEKRTTEIFKRLIEINQERGTGAAGDATGSLVKPVDLGDDRTNAPQEPEQDTLEPFGGVPDQVAPPPPPPVEKRAVIGVGDTVKVKFMSSVNAPTDSTPYPVVLKLIGDVQGPDDSSLPLGEARLVAAAQGSLPDSRALFRLTNINIRLPNGRRVFVPIDGWIVGEDGINGLEGVLIDPIGKAIVGGAIAGGLAGFGQAVSSGQTTTYSNAYGTTEVVTGDDGTYAAGRALTGASREWSGIIRDRLDMLVPHVQILSGREATAVFSKTVTIPGLYESYESEQDVFSTMD